MLYSPFRPSRRSLQRLLEEALRAELTYRPVGRTLDGPLPADFHCLEAERTTPTTDWDRARGALRNWSGHRSASAIFEPHLPALTVGETLAFAVRVLGLWATGTCRIVGVIDEPDRFAFAYGTLSHHPETGEERFQVVRNDDGSVTFSVVAYSQPADRITRLLGPIGRRIQGIMTRRYIDGFVSASRTSTPD